MTKTFVLVIGHRGDGKEDFRRRISTYLLYSEDDRECGRAFGLGFQRASVDVIRSKKAYKKDTPQCRVPNFFICFVLAK